MTSSVKAYAWKGQRVSSTQEPPEEFVIGDSICKDTGQAIIYHVTRVADGSPFVIKLAEPPLSGEDTACRILREGMILHEVHLKAQPDFARHVVKEVVHFTIPENNETGCPRANAVILEYLAGASLCEALEKGYYGNASISTLKADILGIAKGVAAFHQCNIVHRDITSRNVMFGSDDTNPRAARIIDAALAKAPESSRFPRTEGSVGYTRFYAAPERVRGMEADKGSDVYSTGMVLLEMAAGDLHDIAAPLDSEKKRLVQRAVERGTVPAKVLEVIEKAIQDERPKRQDDALVLLAELQRGFDARASITAPQWWRDWRSSGAAALLLVAAIGTAYMAAVSPARSWLVDLFKDDPTTFFPPVATTTPVQPSRDAKTPGGTKTPSESGFGTQPRAIISRPPVGGGQRTPGGSESDTTTRPDSTTHPEKIEPREPPPVVRIPGLSLDGHGGIRYHVAERLGADCSRLAVISVRGSWDGGATSVDFRCDRDGWARIPVDRLGIGSRATDSAFIYCARISVSDWKRGQNNLLSKDPPRTADSVLFRLRPGLGALDVELVEADPSVICKRRP